MLMVILIASSLKSAMNMMQELFKKNFIFENFINSCKINDLCYSLIDLTINSIRIKFPSFIQNHRFFQ
jgi:hypothetical protein